MTPMTEEQYIESIRKLNLQIHMFGEKIESPVNHPILRPPLNSVRMTYDLAQDPQYEDLMTTTSAITGNKINRFCHIHHSMQDLVNKVKMQYLLGQKTASCSQCCVGMDALNTLYFTTFEASQQYKTNYLESFKKSAIATEENDWMVDGAMTDPKGDRSLAPHAQPDADMYLHVVERRPGGIIMRGAKAHQTGITDSHEMIVMSIITMGPDDKDYVALFVVPTDAEGTFMIIGCQSCDTRKLEGSEMNVGNSEFGGVEALVVFDNVFVPNDRIFLNGEVGFAGMLVGRFAGYHRQSYGGCRVGAGDALTGVVALVAEYNDVERAFAVKDKPIEMVYSDETLFACGIACSSEGKPTPSGNYLIDLLLANARKQNVTRLLYEIIWSAEDIADGLMVTAPSEKDLRDPVVGPYVDKYLRGVNAVSTENRLHVLRLIENTSLGTATAGYCTESTYGAGSPQAQRIVIARQGNISTKKKLVKAIAYID